MSDASNVAWEMAEHLDPPNRAHTIVDLGAGRGDLLNALVTLGYPVSGCEPSTLLCQIARAAHLLAPSVLSNVDPFTHLDTLEASGRPVAGFILWRVLDRQRDPAALLHRVVDLAAGGMLFIEFALPVADAFSDTDPGAATPPFFPTPATLEYVRDALGLTIEGRPMMGADGLRVFFRSPTPEVVELNRMTVESLDLLTLEAEYRRRLPQLTRFLPPIEGSPGGVTSDGVAVDGGAVGR